MNQVNCNCPMQPMPYNNSDCRDSVSADWVLAMSYVPWQTWNKTYELDKALHVGTLFPCLDKPFMGRCACK